jgi:hypothetical protein
VISLVVNFGYLAIFKKKLGKPCIFSVKCVLKTKVHHFCESLKKLKFIFFGEVLKIINHKEFESAWGESCGQFEQINVNYCKYCAMFVHLACAYS